MVLGGCRSFLLIVRYVLIPNMLGFRARTQRKDREIVAFFSMERNWN